MKSIKQILFVCCFLAITVASCKDGQGGGKLTVGVHAWPGGGMVYIGDKLGYFKEEGIELTIKKIENFDSKRASLISGDIDIDVANTMDQLLIYNEVGFPAQIIGVTDESVGGDGIVSLESIRSLADLKGKTISYAEASPSDFFLRYLLKKNGISTDSVKLQPAADPQIAGNAVIAKQVDAAVTYEPFLSQAEETDGLHMLASTKQYPTLIPGLLIADKARVEIDNDLYAKFLRAWFKSVDYYYSNKEAAEKIISEGMGMNIQEVRDILSVVEIQTREGNKKLLEDPTKDDLYELVSSITIFWKENKFITKSFDSQSLINKELMLETQKDATAH